MEEQYQRLTLKNIIGFAAPHTWVAAIFPVLLGSLLSFSLAGASSPLLFLALLLAAILMQAAVNTLNDYHDFVKGTDKAENSEDPTDAVLVYNRLNPRHVQKLGVTFLSTALLLGCYAVYKGGWVPLALGALGCFIIVAYSAGKFPISHLPLGEVVSGFVMGGLITLAVFASYTGRARLDILLLSVPFIIGIGLIMMTNNTCDIERDAPTGRHTLAVLLGRCRMRFLYRLFEVTWLVFVISITVLYFPNGLWATAFILTLFVPVLLQMWRAPLTPGQRGLCMGAVLRVNMVANCAYLAGILVHTLCK